MEYAQQLPADTDNKRPAAGPQINNLPHYGGRTLPGPVWLFPTSWAGWPFYKGPASWTTTR